MDYEKMTDEVINSMVADYVFGKGTITILANDMIQVIERGSLRYCSDPKIAWPIIDENNITIINDNPSRRIAVSSASSAFYNGTDAVMAADANGLRAAMIVFLKMMDAGNE